MTERAKWSAVRDARLPTAADRERYDAARRALEAELAAHARTLGELRRARALTQTELAQDLGVSQAQVSRIETQADLYLSTLRSYVRALGGELEMRVVFGDGTWSEVSFADEPPAASGANTAPVVRIVRAGDRTGAFVAVPGTRGSVWHVLPHPGGGWSVSKSTKAARRAAVAETEADAVERATELARRGGGGDVVVHEAL
jgi:DNA-binding XRE family transcriptional regulator